MSATSTSRARRILNRISETWADLDYAQRRLFEIRTGTGPVAGDDDASTSSRRPHAG